MNSDKHIESNVGSRIREIRKKKGLALRALAEKCALSVNAISLIERGENSPTVSSLQKLSLALEVPITDFFITENGLSAVHVKNGQGVRYRKSGVELESLGTGLTEQRLEPFRLTIEPGEPEAEDVAIIHPGQEFVYCLEGELEYFVEGRSFSLSPGDSLLLEATRPHSWRNITSNPATVILIFQAASDNHLARQRHLEATEQSD